MDMRVKIGFAGTIHVNMPGDDKAAIQTAMTKMQALSKKYHFDLVFWTDPIRNEEDGEKVRRFMEAENVDFSLFVNGSLLDGRVMLPLSKLTCRIGIWSLPEPTKSGVLQLNSFCSMNMMASILTNYRRYEKIAKWFYGDADSSQFLDRFLVTLRALQAIKALKTVKIGQIGGLANGFENMYIDERDMEKKFGSYLYTRHSVEEIVERAKAIPKKAVKEDLVNLEKEGKIGEVHSEQVEKSIRVYLALQEFARERNYDALAICCWPRFQETYGIAVCGAMSRLNESDILAVCEADIPSTLTMIMLKAMSGKKPALSDLVDIDSSDGSVNLWHCGVAPSCWADENGVTWNPHFNIGHYENEVWKGDGLVAEMRFKAGVATVASMTADFDSLFVLTGSLMAEKEAFSGSSGWMRDLHVNGTVTDMPTLVNTIMVNSLHHHYSSSYGDLTNEMNEFAAWMDMRVIDPVPYRPFLQL